MTGHGHGTMSRYNAGCGCGACRDANSDRCYKARAAMAERGREDPALIPHGTPGGYTNWACRCEACRAAHQAACRRWRALRVARAVAAITGAA